MYVTLNSNFLTVEDLRRALWAMICTDFQFLEHKICINKISVPVTGQLSITIVQKHIWFRGEGHRSIADRRLHMFQNHT